MSSYGISEEEMKKSSPPKTVCRDVRSYCEYMRLQIHRDRCYVVIQTIVRVDSQYENR